MRDETKYDRLITFGRALPQIRVRVEQDLRRRELSREKVLATFATCSDDELNNLVFQTRATQPSTETAQ